MAKYKIIPSSRTIVQSPISIGHKAEKGVEAIEFDVTAWVETYGSGTLTIIMRRWGDVIPYPIALEIDENNKATWTLSDIDTAKAGMAYAQLNYIVGDEVVKKSDIYTFRVMDSLTGEGDPPEAYESWLEHLTHLAAEAMAEVLDIEGIVTDKTLSIDGGIADAKAAGDALALKADKATTYTKAQVDQMIEDVEVETDTTLTISGAPADAKKTGDALSALEDQFTEETDQLKADLATLADLQDGKFHYPLIPNKYYNYNGELVPYNGWSATSVISCENVSALYIHATAKSTFNIWFNSAEGGTDHKIGGFTVNAGDNIIPIRAGATHFALSNATAEMQATTIRIVPTYEEYIQLKASVEANTSAIEHIIQEGTAEYTSVLYLNPKPTVGNLVIESHKKINPWHISPKPTVQDVVSFGVITDLHGSKTELERYVQFCNEYSAYLNGGLLSLGDMVTNIYSNDYTFWLNTDGADEIMLTIGNHDVWLTNSVSSELAPKTDAYAKYFAPNISKWGVTQPSDASTNGLMYWHKDYAESKLRVIVLDCMYWDSNENTWFINTLNDAKTNGYNVLAIQHYNPSKNLTAMEGNFNSLDYGFSHLVSGTASAQMVQAAEGFIGDGGSFIGWLSGDSHYDAFGVYENNSIKQASFTFEAGGHLAGWGDAERIVGQKSQDSFNIVSVDTYSKLIKIVRVGNDSDRFLRRKSYLTYDYSNHAVVTTG